MNIYPSIAELRQHHSTTRFAMTIGNFDGIHRGHQALLAKLQSYGVPTAVLTFAKHPLDYLRPPAPKPIASLKEKLKLLAEQGIDCTVVIDFPQIVNTPFDQFLSSLPLSHLVLGEGAAFGKNRAGTEPQVKAWGEKHGVQVEYIKKIDLISSSQIRAALAAGDLALAETLLGHPLEKHHVIN